MLDLVKTLTRISILQEQVDNLAAMADGGTTPAGSPNPKPGGALAAMRIQQCLFDLREDMRSAVADSAAGCTAAQKKVLTA